MSQLEVKRNKLLYYNEKVLQKYFSTNLPKRLIVHSVCHDKDKKLLEIDYKKLDDLQSDLQSDLQNKINNDLKILATFLKENLPKFKQQIGSKVSAVETNYHSRFPNDPIWFMSTFDIHKSVTILDVDDNGNLIVEGYGKVSLKIKEDLPYWLKYGQGYSDYKKIVINNLL